MSIELKLIKSKLQGAQWAILLELADHPFLQTKPVEVMSAVGDDGVRVVHVFIADTADIIVFSQFKLASRRQRAESPIDLSQGKEVSNVPIDMRSRQANAEDKVEEQKKEI